MKPKSYYKRDKNCDKCKFCKEICLSWNLYVSSCFYGEEIENSNEIIKEAKKNGEFIEKYVVDKNKGICDEFKEKE